MLRFCLYAIVITVLLSDIFTNFVCGNICVSNDDVLRFNQGVELKKRWAIVTLTKHGLAENKRDINKRNKMLAEKLRPYAHNHNFTFVFFSEHTISSTIIEKWQDVFKGIGPVRYISTHHLGLNGNFNYNYMCKFYSTDLYELLKDYDYYMRADTDVYIEQLEYDMFQWFENNNGGYGLASRKMESHVPTLDTMSKFMKNYTSSCSIVPKSLMGLTLNDCINFYNNWHIGRVSFFLRPDVQHFLNAVLNTGSYVKHRWGDSPVQAYTVRIFMDTDQILQVPNFTYIHGSHEKTISTYVGNNITWSNRGMKFEPFWKNTKATN